MLARLLALAALLAAPALASEPAAGGPCRDTRFEGVTYTVCEVSAGQDLRLWLTAPDGRPVGSFERLREIAEADGRRLVFAMNAGMYHADRSPVGLYVEEGTEAAPLVSAGGGGNFGLLPNGIFCVADERFAVLETRAFRAAPPACRFATQSGPMLVIGGDLHPRFLPDSDSLYIRNGVGVSADGRRAVFAISRAPVNFHAFARFFRDELDLPDALYLDGSISRLYAPGLGRNEGGRPMGPIVGLLADR
ncbi:phosphodiester glycosidase family protein [Frigidibacter oleivorans]|uniref:phosphodiester glycosidase family protein n=1 Tax=Frigidibacter oleivorans TaxID=2487129 RepID=UPI000F8D048B|nr:phosphodiester glycosidase family protein [Frigidibacter oleivorans]